MYGCSTRARALLALAPAVPSGSRAGGALHIQASCILGGILPAGTQTMQFRHRKARHGSQQSEISKQRLAVMMARIVSKRVRGRVGSRRSAPAATRRGRRSRRGARRSGSRWRERRSHKNVAVVMSRLRKRQRSPDSPISLQLLSGFPSERGSTHETPNPLPRRADQMEIQYLCGIKKTGFGGLRTVS